MVPSGMHIHEMTSSPSPHKDVGDYGDRSRAGLIRVTIWLLMIIGCAVFWVTVAALVWSLIE